MNRPMDDAAPMSQPDDSDRQAQQHVPSHSLSTTTASTPVSSAPPTPIAQKSPIAHPQGANMRHPATSPLLPPNSPRPPNKLRRASSGMDMVNNGPAQRSTSSPKLSRKGSRTSIGGGGAMTNDDAEKRPTPKRSISNLIAGLREAQSTMEPIQEPITLTAGQVATEYFTRQLSTHAEAGIESDTVVVLHDACYGHRYSRLRATKTALSMIVERPERIQASVLGASAAYIRLGGHHAGERNAPHPDRKSSSPPPFKIRRTQRAMDVTSSYVTNVHGKAWMDELKTMCTTAGEKLAAGTPELSRPVASIPAADSGEERPPLHEGDLYLCSQSLAAFQGALGGVAEAIDAVFDPTTSTKKAFVAIRPPGHHCSADYPSGFCWLNNVHVGIEYAAQTFGLTHAAILDFDLHHGDGSQAITWERNRLNHAKRQYPHGKKARQVGPDIGYYSLHDINSYPCESGDDEKVQAASLCIDNAHGQSIWNVHLQPWKTEADFWRLYHDRYRVLLDKARAFLRLHASSSSRGRAAIFISAGFDASEWEGAGMQRHKVSVPTGFYAKFTADVVALAKEPGSGCEGRVISVLEGGYSDRALCSGVLSHLAGLCGRAEGDMNGESGLEGLMGDLSMGLDAIGAVAGQDERRCRVVKYDESWWSEVNLTALENRIHPPPPPGPGKKLRTSGPQPTYATPTESFAYKVVNPTQFARSISGTMREAPTLSAQSRPLPAPPVDWVTATQELRNLLVPSESERTIRSCTAEELGGVKVPKKEKEKVEVMEGGKPGLRQLRERGGPRATPPGSLTTSGNVDLDDTKSVSARSTSSASTSRGGNRRQTVHDLSLIGAETTKPVVADKRRMSRRLSAGSVLSASDGGMSVKLEDEERPPVPALPFGVSGEKANNTDAPAEGLQVKKSRMSNTATKPTISRVPTTTSTGGGVRKTPNVAVGTVDGQTSSVAAPPPASAPKAQPSSVIQPPSNNGGEDVDALMAGMKRISLKVGSREEHDQKLKEKEASDRRARALKGAETRRINAAAKKAAAAAASKKDEKGIMSPGVQTEGTVQTSIPPTSSTIPAVSNPAPGLEMNAQTFQSPPTSVAGINQGSYSVPDVFTEPRLESRWEPAPYIDPQLNPPSAASQSTIPAPLPAPAPPAPAPPAIPPQASAHSLAAILNPSDESQPIPTNGSTISTKSSLPSSPAKPNRVPSTPTSSRKNPTPLPIWTSTGPIPFAASAAAASRQQQNTVSSPRSSASAAYNNPSSPRSSVTPKWKHQRPEAGIGDGNGVSRSMLGGTVTDVEMGGERGTTGHENGASNEAGGKM